MKKEKITERDKDFAKWYTDVVKAAHLATYSSVKGCIIFEPNGYALWEEIQKTLDKMFKNKLVIIPGTSIKLAKFFGKFVPIKLMLKITYKIQKKKVK